jgi:PEGA domain
VYAGALKSVQQQKHEVQTKDEKIFTVDFHVGMTAWSWGYNMRLVVTPIDESHSRVTVGVLKSGGKVFSWGSGDKEVKKILDGIDAELTMLKATSQQTSPSASTADTVCVVDVLSEPAGADVELDGKFVGNTPTTLRLKAGDYKLTVKKEGFAPWTRQLAAMAGNQLSIKAELIKAQFTTAAPDRCFTGICDLSLHAGS